VAAAPAPVAAGLQGLCPRCGAATLFAGVALFADRCRACGLDLTQFNVGDGPAAFLTLIVGALVTIGAVAVQLTWDPPLWLQMLLWLPVTAALVVVCLRVAKGALLAIEYRRGAREGRPL
jgi:uncharacterized protein (DUF983 family)